MLLVSQFWLYGVELPTACSFLTKCPKKCSFLTLNPKKCSFLTLNPKKCTGSFLTLNPKKCSYGYHFLTKTTWGSNRVGSYRYQNNLGVQTGTIVPKHQNNEEDPTATSVVRDFQVRTGYSYSYGLMELSKSIYDRTIPATTFGTIPLRRNSSSLKNLWRQAKQFSYFHIRNILSTLIVIQSEPIAMNAETVFFIKKILGESQAYVIAVTKKGNIQSIFTDNRHLCRQLITA